MRFPLSCYFSDFISWWPQSFAPSFLISQKSTCFCAGNLGGHQRQKYFCFRCLISKDLLHLVQILTKKFMNKRKRLNDSNKTVHAAPFRAWNIRQRTQQATVTACLTGKKNEFLGKWLDYPIPNLDNFTRSSTFLCRRLAIFKISRFTPSLWFKYQHIQHTASFAAGNTLVKWFMLFNEAAKTN